MITQNNFFANQFLRQNDPQKLSYCLNIRSFFRHFIILFKIAPYNLCIFDYRNDQSSINKKAAIPNKNLRWRFFI